ncbi:MAG: cyclase family protein [Anaerolineae bacterium]|nr:cyclase family protein [Anaerolineae bacterium]
MQKLPIITDLTLTLRNGMRGVSLEPNTSIAVNGFNTSNYHLYSHCGTHMDAPLHFVDGGNTIDKLDLRKCMGEAHVINCAHAAPNAILYVEDLGDAAQHIQPGDRVLIRTDWDRFADDENDYRANMPRLSPALAHWLVQAGVVLIGLETPSVASLRPENKAELIEVHQILLRSEMVIVESLCNLKQLQKARVQFIALPLKLDGKDGSPVRAIAIE